MGKSEKNVTIEPGIVKLPSGKYKVTLDYGRDEVTGKQKKTHKTVDTLKEARAKAYEATEWVQFDNKYMRHDIGKAIDEA